MQEWTDRLRQRRAEIIERIAQIGMPKVGTRGYAELPALRQELVSIEQTLAQVESTEALRRDTEAREAVRAGQDDAAYWWRRFNASLAIGNGAGFAIVTAGLLQSSHLDQSLVFGWEFIVYFGAGVLCAGALPWVLWAQRRFERAGRFLRGLSLLLTTLAAGFFVFGVGWAMYRVTVAQPAATAVAKAQREVEGADLAKKWLALHPPAPITPKK